MRQQKEKNSRADSEFPYRETIGGIRQGCSVFWDKRLALFPVRSCCVDIENEPGLWVGGSAFRGSLGRCLKNANHMNEQPPKNALAKAFPSAAAPLLTLHQPTCASCCPLSTQTDATQQVGKNVFLCRLAGGGAGPVGGRTGSMLAALLSSSSKHPHHPTLNPHTSGSPRCFKEQTNNQEM